MASISDMYNTARETTIINSDGNSEFQLADNLDVIAKSSGSVPHLKFPHDITTDYRKQYKSINLYFLKDIAWNEIVKALGQGAKDSLNTFINNAIKTANLISDGQDTNKTSNIEAAGNAVQSLVEAGLNIPSSVGTGMVSAVRNLGSQSKISTKNLQPEDYLCVITLPIPNNLTEDDTQSYDNGHGGKDAAKDFADFIPGSGMVSKAIETVGNTLNGAQGLGQTALANTLGAERRRSRQLAQLPILNPYTWKQFKGSNLKEFRFTFFFVPESQEEAEEIMRIVYTLKKYSYGSKKAGDLQNTITELGNDNLKGAASAVNDFFVSAPPKVLLEFPNPILQKLINPGVCVITSIGTTYNEGTTVGMTADGLPRFIEIQLNLSEYNVRFQEDF